MIQTRSRWLWPALVLTAAIPRLLGAFFLPNAFGDAYVYIRDIGSWSTKISSDTFRLTDLFGFWLPLYQLISALLNVIVKNGFYSGKIVSALFGVGTCILVYLITEQLTSNNRAALLIFLLIALNPLHIFYSASAMTDVPHAFFVLAALYCALKKRWVGSAVFAALAGSTRVESWMFIAIIPVLQFLKERKISITAIVIMIVRAASRRGSLAGARPSSSPRKLAISADCAIHTRPARRNGGANGKSPASSPESTAFIFCMPPGSRATST